MSQACSLRSNPLGPDFVAHEIMAVTFFSAEKRSNSKMVTLRLRTGREIAIL